MYFLYITNMSTLSFFTHENYTLSTDFYGKSIMSLLSILK